MGGESAAEEAAEERRVEVRRGVWAEVDEVELARKLELEDFREVEGELSARGRPCPARLGFLLPPSARPPSPVRCEGGARVLRAGLTVCGLSSSALFANPRPDVERLRLRVSAWLAADLDLARVLGVWGESLEGKRAVEEAGMEGRVRLLAVEEEGKVRREAEAVMGVAESELEGRVEEGRPDAERFIAVGKRGERENGKGRGKEGTNLCPRSLSHSHHSGVPC